MAVRSSRRASTSEPASARNSLRLGWSIFTISAPALPDFLPLIPRNCSENPFFWQVEPRMSLNHRHLVGSLVKIAPPDILFPRFALSSQHGRQSDSPGHRRWMYGARGFVQPGRNALSYFPYLLLYHELRTKSRGKYVPLLSLNFERGLSSAARQGGIPG